MANRHLENLRRRDFRPQGETMGPLGAIARPAGEGDRAVSEVTGRLANRLGALADNLAVAEGTRAGQVAGNDPDFRPTRGWTLRSRAYDQAAIRTFADQLDARLRTEMQTAFEANRESPAALKTAFDGLHEQYLGELADFPEIHGQFNSEFARLRLPFQNKALDNLESRQREARAGALVENLSGTETMISRLAETDIEDPDVLSAIQSEVARAEELLDEAAANDVLTPAQAAKRKIEIRRDAAGRAVLARAQRLGTAEDVNALRAETRRLFAKGEIEGLDAAGFDALDAELGRIERALITDGNQAASHLRKRLDDYVERASDGLTPPSSEWTELNALAAQVPDGEAMVEFANQRLLIANHLKRLSVEEGDELVARMRAELVDGGMNATQAELVRFAEDLVNDGRKALNTDMLGEASRRGLVGTVTPLDWTAAPEDLAAQVQARTAQATAVAGSFDRAPQYLRPDEKQRLAETVAQGGDQALALVQGIVAGAGSDAPAVLAEIGERAPELAQAGLVLHGGGSLQAARDTLTGLQLRAVPGAEPRRMAPIDAGQYANDELGAAFVEHPEDAQRVKGMASAMATTRLERGNVDPSGGEEIYRRSLQEAAGAVFVEGEQYGGIATDRPGWWHDYKVLIPAGVKASEWRNVVRSIRDEDLAGLEVSPVAEDGTPYRARDLHSAVPIAYGDGYRFAMGDPSSEDPQFIRGSDGEPFVLPWDRLEATLRARLPRAFLGGE